MSSPRAPLWEVHHHDVIDVSDGTVVCRADWDLDDAAGQRWLKNAKAICEDHNRQIDRDAAEIANRGYANV